MSRAPPALNKTPSDSCPPTKCYRPQNAACPALLGGLSLCLSVSLAFGPKPKPALYSTIYALCHLTKNVYL